MDENTRKATIWVAVIGLIGTLGSAVIANWDKLIDPTPVILDGTQAGTADENGSSQSGSISDPSLPPPTLPAEMCTVRLAVPANNAVLPQHQLGNRKFESKWLFGWHGCTEASRYHLYVIGPNALNPIVNKNNLTAATYQYQRSHNGIKKLEGWTWKVRAYVDGKWGEWSDERVFDVATPK